MKRLQRKLTTDAKSLSDEDAKAKVPKSALTALKVTTSEADVASDGGYRSPPPISPLKMLNVCFVMPPVHSRRF